MENNKYYTPSVEERYIGWEGEACFSSYGGVYMFDGPSESMTHIPPPDKEAAKFWTKFWIIEEEGLFTANNHRDLKTAIMCLKDGRLRSKYLDKSDIEECGWKKIGAASDGGTTIWQKGDRTCLKYGGSNLLYKNDNDERLRQITIEVVQDDHSFHTLFKGQCPSINELRQIEKLLRIQ